MRRLSALALGAVGLAIVVGGLAAAFAALSGGFVNALNQSRAWVRQPEFTETTRTAEDLFNAAIRQGVIWFEPRGPRLDWQPCEAMFRADLAVRREPAMDDEARRTLDKLCNLAAGRQIMNEMQAWNSSFLIAGVRDNRDRGGDCADGSPSDGAVIQPGCRPAAWAARVAAPGLGAELPLNLMPGASPPPRDFADLAVGTSQTMSDWALFGPLTGANDQIRLTSVIPARIRRMTVDVILEPTRITVGGAAVAVDGRRDAVSLRAGPVSIAAERICPEDSPGDTCAEAMAANAPGGWRLTITAPARTGDTAIAIEGRPLRSVAPDVQSVTQGGPRAARGEDDGRVRLWRSAHIEVICARRGTSLGCETDWREPVRRQRGGGEAGGGAVVFADGQPAIDSRGYPSALVDDLGLTALLGYGPGDLGSLAGSVGSLRTRETLRLTLDPALQKLAAQAVSDHMAARLGRGVRARRPGPLQETTVDRDPEDVGDGRAALVLMDAGDEPGAILAIAGWPRFRAGMNAWDLQALSAGRATDSPLAGHAWRSGDVHAMPGSTFKLVTGLAGIMALKERPELADIISGRTAPGDQQRALGLGGAELTVDGTSIRNYGGAAFANAVLPPGRGGSGCPPARPGGQISVCESLIKSSNLWFGGLALAVDGRRVGRPGATPERTGTWLARATEHYFPIVEAGASPRRQAEINRDLDLMRGLAPGALRLVAEPVELAVEDRRNGRRIDLVTNSYGQGVRASPLAMAAIYGSVGARKVIRPRLVHPVGDVAEHKPAGEGRPLFPGFSEAEARPWAEMVEAGLFGVANSPFGTATRIMGPVPAELRQRIYGKTGTADTVTGMNSAWFAGYINDVAGRRRIAFACWVSHTRDTGGAACGSLIAKVAPQLAAVARRS
jgi:cell division protein FtsI/penicillin-binding protein 2